MRAIKREIAWKRERGKAIKSERVCTYEREIERSVEEWECVCVWERKMEREATIVSPNLFLFSCLLTWQASGTFWGESLFNSFASFVSTTTTVVAGTATTVVAGTTTTRDNNINNNSKRYNKDPFAWINSWVQQSSANIFGIVKQTF